MILPILVLIVGVGIFLFLYRAISLNKISELSRLTTKQENLKNKYDFLLNQKRELKKEIENKKRDLTTLRNNQDGIKTISVEDLDVEDVDENEKVSRYLIQEGKITMEQNEKVLQKMEVLQMDYIGVCMTLGYINLDTAKKAIKINKVVSKSVSFD